MFCENCGAVLQSSNQKFCPTCGIPLRKNVNKNEFHLFVDPTNYKIWISCGNNISAHSKLNAIKQARDKYGNNFEIITVDERNEPSGFWSNNEHLNSRYKEIESDIKLLTKYKKDLEERHELTEELDEFFKFYFLFFKVKKKMLIPKNLELKKELSSLKKLIKKLKPNKEDKKKKKKKKLVIF